MIDKNVLIQAIKTLTDSRGEYYTRTGLGSTGYSWGTEKGMDIILECLVNSVNDEVTPMRTKVNELIDQYNQLLSDYNSSTVPSTAHSVQRI